MGSGKGVAGTGPTRRSRSLPTTWPNVGFQLGSMYDRVYCSFFASKQHTSDNPRVALRGTGQFPPPLSKQPTKKHNICTYAAEHKKNACTNKRCHIPLPLSQGEIVCNKLINAVNPAHLVERADRKSVQRREMVFAPVKRKEDWRGQRTTTQRPPSRARVQNVDHPRGGSR